MKIVKLEKIIDEKRIYISTKDINNKEDILINLCSLSEQKVKNLTEFTEGIFEREEIMSTGLGVGTAFPHLKISSVSEFFVTIGIFPDGVEWDSLDGEPVFIVFLIGGPDGQQNRYLGILAKLSLFAKNRANRETLIKCQTAQEVAALFKGL